MLLLAGISQILASLLAIAIQTHILLLAATPPTVVTTTSVPHLQVLTAKLHPPLTLPMISALKVGDSQLVANKVVLLVLLMCPLSPLYIAGTTTMARSTTLAPTVTGGLLLRTIATLSTTCSTAVVAYIPATTPSTTRTLYGALRGNQGL